jgi:tRNA(Ile)-lysidine synthase
MTVAPGCRSPSTRRTPARTADLLREDAEALDHEADRRFATLASPDGVDVAGLVGLDAAIRHRVVRLACLAAGAIASELTRDHVLGVSALAVGPDGGKQVQLPGHVTAYRLGPTLRFRQTTSG